MRARDRHGDRIATLRSRAERCDWDSDGRDWPNRAASRFVEADGLRWHVQEMGAGPVLLARPWHGRGDAFLAHVWRRCSPRISPWWRPTCRGTASPRCRRRPRGVSLPGMAAGLGALLRKIDRKPEVVAGHSAGAAILARMCLDGAIAPKRLISLNGAFMPLRRIAGPDLLAARAAVFEQPRHPARLRLPCRRRCQCDPAGSSATPARASMPRASGCNRILARSPQHVAAAFAMMANWDLHPLVRDLGKLAVAAGPRRRHWMTARSARAMRGACARCCRAPRSCTLRGARPSRARGKA